MFKLIYRSFVATFTLAVLLCGVYPALVTIIGNIFFHEKANGGMISNSAGKIIGAKLIGQAFTKREYFHGRPSAAGTGNGYDASNSSGSNFGPTNQKLADELKSNIDRVLMENPTLKKGEIPVDLVTSSGSGLDPHISPEAAEAQVDRVAQARGISTNELRKLVKNHTEGPQLGLFGNAVVNVLLLNIELDNLHL